MPAPESPPFALVGLDHVVLRVADMERTIAFYHDVVGAREERRIDDIGLVQMRAGASLIDLVPAEDVSQEAANMEHFAIAVTPFDAVAIANHCAAHDVDAGEPARRYGATGYGPSIYIKDPDGNTIELKGPPE